MKKILLTAAALAALVTGPAFSADLKAPAYKAPPPPPAPVYSWTGCYLGGGGGYGMWNQDLTNLDPFPAVSSIKTTAGGRGWFGTVQVGCDYQLSSDWVIGAFADWDFGDISGTANISDSFSAIKERQNRSWAAGGRFGYVVLPNLLAYVSGGYTQAHFNASELLFADSGAPEFFTLPSHTYSGWFIGTGYEYGLKWLPGFFWKTEYRWSEYQGADLQFVSDIRRTTPSSGFHASKFEQTIRSELVWRFNWAGPLRAAY